MKLFKDKTAHVLLISTRLILPKSRPNLQPDIAKLVSNIQPEKLH